MSNDSQAWFDSQNKENKAMLRQWMKNENISLVQVNGQRKYGGPPPGWVGGAPTYGSEVYIRNLPQEIYEDKIIPLLQSAGKLYEFRLMMTFSGLNRGFAYARFTAIHHANLAVYWFNGYEIQPGYKLKVCKSIEKSELQLDAIPGFLDKDTLTRVMCGITADLERLSLFASPKVDGMNLAVIKYRSHTAAAMARKSLCEGTQLLCGCPLTVEWLSYSNKRYLNFGKFLLPHSCYPRSWTLLFK
ncbi:dead end protein homolog 1 [Mixophyes fleayi]|uniref:dead end protein homolog 1 n=1 Tax=Mixophyes fleayi TaxID=3061075 RepID=UPI003F4D9668